MFLKCRLIHLIPIVACFLFVTCQESNPEETDEVILRLTVPDNYLKGTYELWIFLSDDEGKSFGAQQAVNGTELVFKKPVDFHGDRVNINFFEHDASEENFTSRALRVFAGVKPGDYSMGAWSVIDKESIGTAKVAIENIPEGYQPEAYGNDVRNTGYQRFGDAYVVTSNMTANTGGDLYVAFYNVETGDIRSKMFNGLEPSDSIVADFSDLKVMAKQEFETPSVDRLLTCQVGFVDKIEYGKEFLLYVHDTKSGSNPDNPLRLYAAEEIFDFYSSQMFIYSGNECDIYSVDSAEPPSTIKKLSADMVASTFSDEEISITLTGNADHVWVWGSVFEVSGGHTTSDSYIVTLPFEQQITYKHPSIPDEIVSRYFSDGFKRYPFNYIRVEDRPANASYDDFINYIFQPLAPTGPQQEIIAKEFNLDGTSGGRIRKNSPSGIDLLHPFRRITGHQALYPG